MTQILDAVYENGVFRPVTPSDPGLAEGQQVRLIVQVDTPEDILRLAAQVYEDLSEEDVNAVEQIALDRSAFFTKPPR